MGMNFVFNIDYERFLELSCDALNLENLTNCDCQNSSIILTNFKAQISKTNIVLFFLTGEEKFVSPSYVIENMDRHKGGTYICTANNGVGQTASSQISLHVLCK